MFAVFTCLQHHDPLRLCWAGAICLVAVIAGLCAYRRAVVTQKAHRVAWIATAQFLVFATAVASLLLRHIAGDCGCFGSVLATPPSWWHVAGDLALASATAFIALHAPGSVAFDRRLEASGPPETSGELETT